MDYSFIKQHRTKLVTGVLVLSFVSCFLAGGKTSKEKAEAKFDEPGELIIDGEQTTFGIMDLNKNGKLEESEIPDGEYKTEVFGYDLDGNGVLDLEEFKEYMNRTK